ncbi:MAG: cyclase family protein [Flavobacteriales bacterium]
MKASLPCDLEATPIDISIPLAAGEGKTSAWYVEPIRMEPVRANGFVGSVQEGGAVNFRDIYFNPHGHGTHTECRGHITDCVHSINQIHIPWLMECEVITIAPVALENGDQVIDAPALERASPSPPEALVIRTLPNELDKRTRSWSNTNPPYLTREAAKWLVARDVMHLLIDLPSVDREMDGGSLAAHHIFWGIPHAPRKEATITEFVYVPEHVQDGFYGLNLQTAPFENDATPSRPLLLPLAASK